MRRFALLFLLVVALGILIFFYKSPNGETTKSTSVPLTPSQHPKRFTTTISYDNEVYTVSWFELSRSDELMLIPNFNNKQTFSEIIDMKGCKAAINGSFYATDYSPLGLFQVGTQNLSRETTSTLMNGFITSSDTGDVDIASVSPAGEVSFSLQSGPLLILDNNALALKIANDEFARRSAFLRDTNGIFRFLIAYDQEELFSGPLLATLPNVLEAFAAQEGIHIEQAINLDGGSASAFHSPETTLQELSYVGSILCVTP